MLGELIMLFGRRSGSAPVKLYTSPAKGHEVPGKVVTETEWAAMHAELKGRNALFAEAHKQLEEFVLDDAVRFRLAATDAFVEKAQHRLTARATRLARIGVATAIAAFVILLLTAIGVYSSDVPNVADGFALTVFILRTLTVGGFIGGAAYWLVALSRALFHESTVLLTRRHSLRFGRLSVYLHDGQLDADALLKTFRWSDEVSSAFLDVRPDAVKGGPAAIIAQVPPILESAAKVMEAATQTRAGTSGKSSP
jgi:hypothetical protein